MFGALKRGFRSMACLILVRNVAGELRPKRTLAASRGFLSAARLSCSHSACTTKNEIRFVFRFSFFSLHTEWEKQVAPLSFFRFFALPEMRNTKTGPGRISFSLLPVYDLYLLFDFLTGSCNWRGYSTMWIRCVTGVQ